MTLSKIIEILQEKHTKFDRQMIEKSYNFLRNHTGSFSFSDRKNLLNPALERALEAAKSEARSEFICATMLFDLVKRKKDVLNEIKSKLGDDIYWLVKSYDFTRLVFLDHEKRDLVAHSLRTAQRLAGIKVSVPAICCAILHEVPAHTDTSMKDMRKNFTEEICDLIEKFSCIRTIKTSNNKQYVSHLREMVVAMAKDLRVIILKMCSNIDRMKVYGTRYTQRKMLHVAEESLEIMAPLADLLGIWRLRWQLEDQAFKILEPEEYEKIAQRFDVDERKNREKYIQKTRNILEKAAKEAGITCRIEGRFKHFYSIYQKMKFKKKTFNDLCDVFALRIVTDSVDDCYRLMGIIHRLWRPKHRRMKDYIAAPKSNGYRSLHTTVFGLNGRPTEFQIRTKEMDDLANFGIAAHWFYKNPRRQTPEWMQDILVKQQNYKTDEEFLGHFSSELLHHRIYVYTPKGDVISLPSNSTPVDFAYNIHTEIGNQCAGAIVNDLEVPLHTKLKTNDIIDIVVNREQSGPKAEWLNFVKTNVAKKFIEEHLAKNPVERSFRF
jgi:GTP pyrophosphokinase